MKKRLSILIIVVALIVGGEVFLRQYFGFCDTVLFMEDPDFEYIPQPDQHLFRFRNNVDYNAFSMRSAEVDTTAHIILGFGDSVINGGVQTDNDSLATTLLSASLSELEGEKVQMLNIASASWGPDNCYAYLQKYGDFGAKSIFLFVSSHDAYDNMDFQKIVDVHVSFPTKQYVSAIYEVVDRYLMPKILGKFNKKKKQVRSEIEGINKEKDNSVFNTGFENLYAYSVRKHLPFTIYLHADMHEFKNGAYNAQGQEIIQFARDNHIPILLDLENGMELSDFRDATHINCQGQKKIANTVYTYINEGGLAILEKED